MGTKPYPFNKIESKWQAFWEKNKTFSVKNPTTDYILAKKLKKYYILDMFPYPSGDGLHVGHPEGYTASDILTRYKRRNGYRVLHPMGWDAFGLPAEQYAIKTGQHPRITTENNIKKFRKQLKKIGFAYDWEREINTTDPYYYKWTQWIFLKLYNSYFDKDKNKACPISKIAKNKTKEEIDELRLAYIKKAPVNWCPKLGTVLANEEVIDGKSERGGYPVEKRMMSQWMLRITEYSQRLLDGLKDLDWSEGIKLLQKNWIGKSIGANVIFKISGFDDNLEVFTTRPDTLYGATYMVIAPEHHLVKKICSKEQLKEVEKYCDEVASKSELQRTELSTEKTGVFTGAYAINPVNKEKIPIWVADYVLISYGTGAIMAVPAHDERDYDFAKKYNLKIIEVVKPKSKINDKCFSGDGIAINSELINGFETQEAKNKIIKWLKNSKLGKKSINFKLRDWLFSRQRYWGEPFPIIWDKNGHKALDEKDLPIKLPDIKDFNPVQDSEDISSPLSKAKEWVNYSSKYNRETNTMPQWAGSCWYYLRYCDPHNSDDFIGDESESFWSGKYDNDEEKPSDSGMVDVYIGGTEHAVLHLLYARFWHKVLYDLGYLSKPEPFQKLVNQGMILGEDGQKMSKSKGNVINPDDVIDEYGADSLRLFEMFMGPLEQTKPWSTKGIQGVHKFLARVWRLVMDQSNNLDEKSDDLKNWQISKKIIDEKPNEEINRLTHQTIKKVSEDIENLNFNTAISQLMILTNALTALEKRPLSSISVLLSLLEPFAPHIAEELNISLNKSFEKSLEVNLSAQDWIKWDEKFLKQKSFTIVIQINGKVRDKLQIDSEMNEQELLKNILVIPKIKNLIDQKNIIKKIYIPNKLVNLVIK